MSLFSKDTQKGKYIAFNGKKYALNLERLKEGMSYPIIRVWRKRDGNYTGL